MERTAILEPPGFANLSKSEQVEYLQALWDRIVKGPGELPAPESHLEIAEGRLAAHRRSPQESRSAFAVLDRLTEKTR
jgi:hypothetical protein